MTAFLSIALLFMGGSILGWTIELLFRRFFDPTNPERKWINPGFLTGPYLPLYGFVLIMLYCMTRAEGYIPIENALPRKAVLFLLMAAFITIIEYLTGLIFIIKLKIVLWDYTGYFGNVKGIICPLYSFFWLLLSIFYCFAIDPAVVFMVQWLKDTPQMSFFVGLFYGIFFIDLGMSVKSLVSISAFAWKHNIIVYFDEFREQIQSFRQSERKRVRFFLPVSLTDTLTGSLERYKEFLSRVKPARLYHRMKNDDADKHGPE